MVGEVCSHEGLLRAMSVHGTSIEDGLAEVCIFRKDSGGSMSFLAFGEKLLKDLVECLVGEIPVRMEVEQFSWDYGLVVWARKVERLPKEEWQLSKGG